MNERLRDAGIDSEIDAETDIEIDIDGDAESVLEPSDKIAKKFSPHWDYLIAEILNSLAHSYEYNQTLRC